ncbi:unnamed protein product [Meganyctiphanes norvegica]|uniref:Uncharacterized protein n=1 Tax=Meganyctiphanes norvegica TaxID=48144 RepID=A0AAV2RBW0_MEGNR
MSYDYENYEEPLANGGTLEFSDKSIRMGFIRKVYIILMGQLTVTFGMVAAFTLSPDVKNFAAQNQALFWVALVGTLVCIIALSCCGNLRRKTPHNFIFLGIFTICEGFLLGCTSARYTPFEILLAVGICIFITLALTLFAFQTKIDFTMCGGFLLCTLIILIIFGIVAAIWQNQVVHILYSCMGALVFSFYIVFDTQMMIGGNHKYSISPEEYVFAALSLYLDIINLFTYILSIIANFRD